MPIARSIDSIIQRLVDEGVGVEGVTIAAGNDDDAEPTDQPEYIVVHEYGGQQPEGTHNEGFLATRKPSFQIVAKAERYPDAGQLAERAFLAMNVMNETVKGIFFLKIRPMQDPFELPADRNGKARVAFNIETHRRG
jgi:hypothetical protein